MEQLDSTTIAPAIAQIAAAFRVDPLSLNLTMTVYLLCCIVFIPTGGFLANRYGTRSAFKAALALFVLSSALCGMSDNLLTLTLARALQGASAALMVPVGRIAIVHATKRSELVMALAWMITPAMIGPLPGPLLGGLISRYHFACAWFRTWAANSVDTAGSHEDGAGCAYSQSRQSRDFTGTMSHTIFY
jgi:MFS family permease